MSEEVPDTNGVRPDPPPEPPEKPLQSDCCDSGCPICVFDMYADEMAEYRQALAEWQRRQAASRERR